MSLEERKLSKRQMYYIKNKERIDIVRKNYYLHRGKFLMIERERQFRKKAVDSLGGICQRCGSVKNLQLHHKYYARDSIRPKVHNENGCQSKKRNLEALEHPERFNLLCLPCHNKIQPKKQKIVNIAVLFDRQDEV